MQPFTDPRVYASEAKDLHLSGWALQELMRAVLAKGKPFRFCARGWSMAPFIHDGDVITVSPLRSRRPTLGDVVAFVRPHDGRLTVHRVVEIRGNACLIQADRDPEHPDGLIPGQQMIGRVTLVERNGRKVWLGLGPERYLIAHLSRAQLLGPLRNRLPGWLKPIFGRAG